MKKYLPLILCLCLFSFILPTKSGAEAGSPVADVYFWNATTGQWVKSQVDLNNYLLVNISSCPAIDADFDKLSLWLYGVARSTDIEKLRQELYGISRSTDIEKLRQELYGVSRSSDIEKLRQELYGLARSTGTDLILSRLLDIYNQMKTSMTVSDIRYSGLTSTGTAGKMFVSGNISVSNWSLDNYTFYSVGGDSTITCTWKGGIMYALQGIPIAPMRLSVPVADPTFQCTLPAGTTLYYVLDGVGP